MSNCKLQCTLNDGRKIGYAEYGDISGKPLLYFHGLAGSRLEAAHLHETACANGYRLISLDRPGMGLSSRHQERTVLSWAKDVEQVAAYLDINKFSIIGHSGAAPFVAACAYVIPDRLNSAAIVSGMAPLERPESYAAMSVGQKMVYRLIKTLPCLTSVMMKMTKMMLKNPFLLKQMLKELPEVDQILFRNPDIHKAIMDASLEAFRNGIGGSSQEMKLIFSSWGFALENITLPIKIWHGGLDPQAPVVHGKIYANRIPGAQFTIFEKEGHHSILRNLGAEILQDLMNHEVLV